MTKGSFKEVVRYRGVYYLTIIRKTIINVFTETVTELCTRYMNLGTV